MISKLATRAASPIPASSEPKKTVTQLSVLGRGRKFYVLNSKTVEFYSPKAEASVPSSDAILLPLAFVPQASTQLSGPHTH